MSSKTNGVACALKAVEASFVIVIADLEYGKVVFAGYSSILQIGTSDMPFPKSGPLGRFLP